MESLGEGAKVVCMGNTVRLVTQRESESRLHRFGVIYDVLMRFPRDLVGDPDTLIRWFGAKLTYG